jgi:hypothetical protein
MTRPFFAIRMRKKKAVEDLIGEMAGDALMLAAPWDMIQVIARIALSKLPDGSRLD